MASECQLWATNDQAPMINDQRKQVSPVIPDFGHWSLRFGHFRLPLLRNTAVRYAHFSALPLQELPRMAKRGKKKAETVFLVCEESGDHNYILRRKPGGEKLKLMKFSPRLRKHTMHTEKKK
jgi:large subunit ribosomal protein L33